MNFIGPLEGREIQVELKYCERGGGLWLRPQGTEGAYCSGCQLRLGTRPVLDSAPTCKKRRRPRPGGLNSESASLQARIERLQGVAVIGVRA